MSLLTPEIEKALCIKRRWLDCLHLFERRLVNSYATVVIPFDERVIFIDLANRAKFSIRHSEVAQTFDAISGTKILASAKRFDKRRRPRSARAAEGRIPARLLRLACGAPHSRQ